MYSTKQLQTSGMENRPAHCVPSTLKTGGTQLHAIRGEKSQYTVCLLSLLRLCRANTTRAITRSPTETQRSKSRHVVCLVLSERDEQYS